MKNILPTVTAFLLLFIHLSCGQQQSPATEASTAASEIAHIGDTVKQPGKEIDCIFQDRQHNYWFASNGEGVFRYNGRTMLHITNKHGLCSNFVWEIRQDVNNKIWFFTRDGICCLDGNRIVNYTDSMQNAPYGKLHYTPGGLFFGHLNGLSFYNGNTFTNFTIHPSSYSPPANNLYRPYAVYDVMKDSAGHIWFGTQEKGVCWYNDTTFTYITGKNLDGYAVRCVFQDSKGNYWFGNNGGGLYQYKNNVLRNITEELELGNAEFLRGQMNADKPGSMARVFAINEDKNGHRWVGTADAGVWEYDGSKWTNYTAEHGLSGYQVTVIFKDLSGELWFVSNGNQVSKFDGERFIPWIVQ
jgi:ligand-binding sensor domain-containing protein